MIELQDAAARHPAEFPFLLVDKVLGAETGERAIGLRNVTANDPLLASGGKATGLRRSLLIEAFAQLVAIALAPGDSRPSAVDIARIDSMTFERSPVPGDQIVMTVELARPATGGPLTARCKAEIGGELISQGTLEVEPAKVGDDEAV